MVEKIHRKTLANGFQPELPLWPSKDRIELPTVKPIPLINPNDPYLKRLWTLFTKRPKWIVREDYFCWIDYCEAWVWIPTNFIFDFASIPKAIPVVNPTGVFAYPALPHDFVYRFGCLLLSTGPEKPFNPVYINRKTGDKIFLELAKRANGLGVLDNVSTFMLRVFGGCNYNPRGVMDVNWNNLVKIKE